MGELAVWMVAAAVQVLACGLLLWVARAVLGHRLAARWRVAAWLVLALRLLVPVNLTLPQPPVQLPVTPVAAVQQAGPAPVVAPQWQTGALALAQQAAPEAAPGPLWRQAALWVWATGVVLMLGWQLFVRLRFALRQRDKQPVVLPELAAIAAGLGLRHVPAAYRTSAVDGPVLAGWPRPQILLPLAAEPKTPELALWHELCHIKRRDLLAKQLFTLVAILYWPLPFVHLMRHLAVQDMELACDEKVLQCIGAENRVGYAQAILACVPRARRLPGSASAFSTGGRLLRKRLTALFRAPARRISVALLPATMALVLLAGCMVGPVSSELTYGGDASTGTLPADETAGDPIFTPRRFDEAVLQVCPVTGLSMTAEGVRLVQTSLDLNQVGRARDSLAFDYIQTADIYAYGYFDPIGGDEEWPFTGSYDGNGYSIIRLEASEGSLFGHAKDAVIQRVVLRDAILPDGVDGQSAIVASASGCVLKDNFLATGVFTGSVDVTISGMPLQFYEGGDGHPYIYYDFCNNSSEPLYGATLYFTAFDENGQPLECAWFAAIGGEERSYLNSTYLSLITAPLAPGETFGMDGGWSLPDLWHGGTDTDVAYIIATFESIEFASGMWHNPGIEQWKEKWVGRPATVAELEGYYAVQLAG